MDIIKRDLQEFGTEVSLFLNSIKIKKPSIYDGFPNAEILINWENMPVRHNFIFKKQ